MQLGSEITLGGGPYTVRLAPAAGARLTSLTWTDGSGAHELIMPLTTTEPFDAHHWPPAGAFPMAPYSNRLGGATFNWGARQIRLTSPTGETYALHGFAHRSSWQVASQTASEAMLQYTHRAGHEGWPWSFDLMQQVVLDDTGALVRLRITNTSDEAMPAGLGWHPYHPARRLARDAQVSLRVTAHARRNVGLDGLARLEPRRGTAETTAMNLSRADLHHQTCVFEDWSGTTTLPLDQGLTLDITTTGMPHLVMHAAKELAYLCLEPVTLLPGALQVYGAAQSAEMIALAPNCSREITWRCSVQREPFTSDTSI